MRIIKKKKYLIYSNLNEQIKVLGYAESKKEVPKVLKQLFDMGLTALIVMDATEYRRVYV